MVYIRAAGELIRRDPRRWVIVTLVVFLGGCGADQTPSVVSTVESPLLESEPQQDQCSNSLAAPDLLDCLNKEVILEIGPPTQVVASVPERSIDPDREEKTLRLMRRYNDVLRLMVIYLAEVRQMQESSPANGASDANSPSARQPIIAKGFYKTLKARLDETTEVVDLITQHVVDFFLHPAEGASQDVQFKYKQEAEILIQKITENKTSALDRANALYCDSAERGALMPPTGVTCSK